MSRRIVFPVVALMALVALPTPGGARPTNDNMNIPFTRADERDRIAPVDYGPGPGRGKSKSPKVGGTVETTTTEFGVVARLLPYSAAPLPTGPNAKVNGVFGEAFTFPIIPLHMVLLPDGRVLSYGTLETGKQGAQLNYAIWDPSLGTGPEAHLSLPNTTATDLFCSAQSLMAVNGQVLITGGDMTINGERNYSNQETELFDPATNELETIGPMQYKRWYPTLVALASGELVVVGGNQAPKVSAPTPEVFNIATGWRTLTNATSEDAYGRVSGSWYYPRAFAAPDGKIVIINNKGQLWRLDPAGNGSITKLSPRAPSGSYRLPAVMYEPGKILAIRQLRKVVVLDLNTNPPTITPTADISQERLWANASVLPNGKVLVTGGSAVANELTDVALHAEIWDPATGTWSTGASATKARLYHSVSMLLPDATVITAGGGAPGPIKQLNGEIYYPGYLYNNDGSPAKRPELTAAPDVVHHGDSFDLGLRYAYDIRRVTLVRFPSVTHSMDVDQRFFELSFAQDGKTITTSMPADPNVLIPGYYMLFVMNETGTPSRAAIIEVPVPAP